MKLFYGNAVCNTALTNTIMDNYYQNGDDVLVDALHTDEDGNMHLTKEANGVDTLSSLGISVFVSTDVTGNEVASLVWVFMGVGILTPICYNNNEEYFWYFSSSLSYRVHTSLSIG